MAGRPVSGVLWFSRQDDGGRDQGGSGAGGDEWSESKYILNVELVGFVDVLTDWVRERDRETSKSRMTEQLREWTCHKPRRRRLWSGWEGRE